MKKETLMLNLSITILLCLVNMEGGLKAQSSEYTIESFQDDGYTELTSYQSIALLTNWHPFWTYEFDFGFPFPFYDFTYNKMLFRYNGWESFTDEEDTAIFLMEYGWTHEAFVDSFNIPSDV